MDGVEESSDCAVQSYGIGSVPGSSGLLMAVCLIMSSTSVKSTRREGYGLGVPIRGDIFLFLERAFQIISSSSASGYYRKL